MNLAPVPPMGYSTLDPKPSPETEYPMRVCPSCNRLYGPKQETCKVDNTPTVDHVQVLIGGSLGPYQVKSVIGQGGMGVVYLGEHPTIGRKVALKVMRPELSLRDQLVERFIQEARSVNTIGHDNIVNIYDFGKTPFGSFYIVMEHLDGEDMRTLLEQEGPQPLARARVVVRCIGAALAAAHAKEFIHRDVKPENIMLVKRLGKEHAKLLDFGIVKLLTEQQDVYQTQVGAAPLGTPEYMSPEQLEQGGLNHRTDIYSLAVVVYELITGQLPFPGNTPLEVRQAQLSRTPTAPSVLREDIYVSRSLDAALLWALSLDPAARCGQITDFISAFEEGYRESLAGPGEEDSFSDFTELTGPHPPRKPSSRLALPLGLAVLTCGLAAAGYLLLRPPVDPGARSTPPAVAVTAPAKADASAPDLAVPKDPREQARARVLAALRSVDPGRRTLVAMLLGELGKPMLTAELKAGLRDKDPGASRAAAKALGQMGDRGAVPALKQALGRSVGYAAVDIALSLAQLGEPAGTRRLHQELKKARDDFRRKYVLHALGRVGDPAARGWWKLIKSTLINPTLRIKALGYLAATGDKRAVRLLEEATGEGSWQARILAAAALWPVKEAPARRTLIQALDLDESRNKVASAMELARFGVPEAGETLVKFLSKSGMKLGPKLRGGCALALGNIPGEDARRALAQALNDPDQDVALAAAVAYLRFGQPQD